MSRHDDVRHASRTGIWRSGAGIDAEACRSMLSVRLLGDAQRHPDGQKQQADVDVDVMSTGELLDAWRDTSRAAELAERLAEVARSAVEKGERDAASTEEIATLAEEVAASASRAAAAARDAARIAASEASGLRGDLEGADRTAADARIAEGTARDRYHEAESDARHRYEADRR